MIRERIRSTLSGWLVVPLLLAAVAALVYGFVTETTTMASPRGWAIAGYMVLLALSAFMFLGCFTVNPNEARVLQLFGKYAGTVKTRRLPLGESPAPPQAHVAAGQELRKLEDQGQRSRG